MTVPLIILAVCAVLVGFIGTPALPWFKSYLTGRPVEAGLGKLFSAETMGVMLLGTLFVFSGIYLGWRLYRHSPASDPLQTRWPNPWRALSNRLCIDELYDVSVIPFARWIATVARRADSTFFAAVSSVVAAAAVGLGWLSRLADRFLIDAGFDRSCDGLSRAARAGRAAHRGTAQGYLRALAISFTLILLLLAWGCKGGS